MSPRPPPKISLRHDEDWTRGKVQLGSTVEQQPHGKVVLRSRGEVEHAAFSQLTQPIPKPISDRSGQPDGTQGDDRSGQPDGTQGVFVVKGETFRSHEINEKDFHKRLCESDRSGQPDDVSENTRVEQTHDRSFQPDERNNSSVHKVKEKHAPE